MRKLINNNIVHFHELIISVVIKFATEHKGFRQNTTQLRVDIH